MWTYLPSEGTTADDDKTVILFNDYLPKCCPLLTKLSLISRGNTAEFFQHHVQTLVCLPNMDSLISLHTDMALLFEDIHNLGQYSWEAILPPRLQHLTVRETGFEEYGLPPVDQYLVPLADLFVRLAQDCLDGRCCTLKEIRYCSRALYHDPAFVLGNRIIKAFQSSGVNFILERL